MVPHFSNLILSFSKILPFIVPMKFFISFLYLSRTKINDVGIPDSDYKRDFLYVDEIYRKKLMLW